MKSNLFRKATALGVATAMVFSTNAFATASLVPGEVSKIDTQTVTTKSTVEAPTYKLKVPTALSFVVDPYEFKLATGSAINERSAIKVPGYGYAISNQSNIAVAVAIEAFVVPKTGVYTVPLDNINTHFTVTDTSLLTSYGAIATAPVIVDDPANVAKEVAMHLLIASTSAIGTNGAAADGTIYTANGALELNVIPTDAAIKPASATFILNKNLVANATVNADPNGYACFSLQGDVNAKATWLADDVNVTVKYVMTPVPESNRVDRTSAGYETGMSSVEKGTAIPCENPAVAPATPKLTIAVGATTINKSGLPSSTTDHVVDVGAGYKEVSNAGTGSTTVRFVGPTGVQTSLTPTTDYVWTDSAKLTLNVSAYTKLKAATIPNGAYTLEAISKNGKTVKATFTLAD